MLLATACHPITYLWNKEYAWRQRSGFEMASGLLVLNNLLSYDEKKITSL